MKVLVVGSGGREHAIAWKIKQSKLVDEIFVAPGNGGMEEIAECLPIKPTEIDKIINFAKNVDLIIIGPEGPLVEGIVNELPKNKAFGPSKESATIEGDKAYAKEIMKKANIATGKFEIFYDKDLAIKYLENAKYPIVIKAAGLAGGKGSFVVNNYSFGKEIVNKIMVEKVFGKAGNKIVIEEYLEGEEVSVIAFTDGKDFIPLLPCKDHKRLLENDKGPNTGGMGAYAPAVITKDEVENVIERILAPCVWALAKEGTIYKGILYAGLMITNEGPKVLEFNCRFGDPETQPVLPLLKTDIMEIILATIEGNLKSVSVDWEEKSAACVILASKGYPDKYEIDKEIIGLDKVKNSIIFHSGTKKVGNKFLTAGGRVLGITAIGKNLEEAVNKVYKDIEFIYFEGMHYRKDIGRATNSP